MNLANYIDRTVLQPDCRLEDVKEVCQEAILHDFAAVCIPPFFVKPAADLLEGKKVKVATVIGYPMGYAPTSAKVEEMKRVINDGTDELEAVVNLCAVKNNNWNFVANDIDSMTTAAHLKGKVIKIILEPGLLTEEEMGRLCEIAVESKVDFLKACTGLNGQVATIEMIELLRKLSNDKIKITTFGGIQTQKDAKHFIKAGARRIGITAGVTVFG